MTRKLTLYRDDSTVQVVYERVKAVFWTADARAAHAAYIKHLLGEG